MPLTAFDHVNIRTSQLDAMIAWYGDVLDLHPGDRPPFDMGGAWLYLGDQPVVHLVDVTSDPRAGENLSLEHFAFRAKDMAAFLSLLKSRDIPYRIGEVPAFPIVQINIADPDGNHIHVDFYNEPIG